ncbi:MAG: DUF1634 domain-containing protein [Methanomassiliicoccus sp.]|nr:DUF1634 domain-containing protein [Methanomassiliicoccus sp.]
MRFDEHEHSRTEKWVQLVLRWGMVLSLSVLLLGLALFVLSPPGQSEVDLSPGEIVAGIVDGNAVAVIDLGIVLLIATPLTRVLTTLVIFIVDREYRFVFASLLVLGVISAAILLG